MAASPDRRGLVTRRGVLAGLAAGVCGVTVAGTVRDIAVAEVCSGPTFSPSGPDAELYGASEGFPVPDSSLARRQGNPYEPRYRIGAFSHFDEIYPTRRIMRGTTPWNFKRTAADIRYRFRGSASSLKEYLSRNPVTGLLIAKDDQILFEQYRYARADHDRFISQSMVKSIMGILIGIAISEGAIKSVDDTPETYVPGFRGTEYGNTPIRDLLHMSSGVEFGEERDAGRDLNRLWIDMIAGISKKGTINSITQFNRRIAPPGTRYYYASIEPDVLGVVLHYATERSAADYLQEKVWQPIGAEADATWLVDAEGFEVAHFGFNAVLRDYARFGRLLAHDGAWDGEQIIPAQWMIDATTTRPSDSYLLPGKSLTGYGYLIWLLPGAGPQFALIGALGQYIFIDPSSQLVMVQTALEAKNEIWHLWSALVEQFS
jgi:CubicO group peptidase (beta-lactamase class C family)